MKKSLFIFLTALILATLCITACKKNEEKEDCRDIVIADGRLLSPQWMVHVIDSMVNIISERQTAHTYGVYSFEYQNQTYITFEQPFSSDLIIPLTRVYTCSGIKQNSIYFTREIFDAYSETGKIELFVLFCYRPNCRTIGFEVSPDWIIEINP